MVQGKGKGIDWAIQWAIPVVMLLNPFDLLPILAVGLYRLPNSVSLLSCHMVKMVPYAPKVKSAPVESKNLL